MLAPESSVRSVVLEIRREASISNWKDHGDVPTKIRVGTDPNKNSLISSLCTKVTKEKALNFNTKTSYTKNSLWITCCKRAYKRATQEDIMVWPWLPRRIRRYKWVGFYCRGHIRVSVRHDGWSCYSGILRRCNAHNATYIGPCIRTVDVYRTSWRPRHEIVCKEAWYVSL